MTGKIGMTEQIRHQLTLSPCCDLGWVRDLWLARLLVTQSCWCWVVVAVCARRGSVEDCTALELSAQFRRAVTPHSAQPGQPASALPGSSTRGYIQHTQHSHPDTAPPSPARSTHLPTILGCLQPRTISSTGAASEMCKFPCQQRMRGTSLGQMDGSTTSTLHRPGEGKYNPQCM